MQKCKLLAQLRLIERKNLCLPVVRPQVDGAVVDGREVVLLCKVLANLCGPVAASCQYILGDSRRVCISMAAVKLKEPFLPCCYLCVTPLEKCEICRFSGHETKPPTDNQILTVHTVLSK